MDTLRALIVDENPSRRSQLMQIIQLMAPIVMSADNYDEGYARARVMFPDIVIAGLNVSDTRGIDFCRQLNAGGSTRKVPVVLVGDRVPDKKISLGFKSGANAYIEITTANSRLPRIIKNLLTKGAAQSEKCILVVDDSSSIRQMLSQGLSSVGYRVIPACHGRQALDILADTRPDLILSDIYMPEMNGFQFCETLCSDPDLSAIPLVVMSTKDDAGNMKRMMQYGADSFIIKPFNIEQLILVLNRIFSFQFDLVLKEKERLDMEYTLLISGITSLITALEARDSYTRGHSERVAKIVATLVKKSGGSRSDIDRAMIGGKLHDIGKIGIRDNVLLKNGALTQEEYHHIQQHPEIGTHILKPIISISDILPMVSSHHERIDGNGYPEGLKGGQIPLWARMTAVADTYDALTSDRAYRKGMPRGKAKQIIEDAKGSQLCPECVNLLFEIV